MSHLRPLFLILLAVLAASPKAGAITGDELASYFGINSWTTKVFLDPGSYMVEIHEIKDGKVDHLIVEGDARWTRPKTGVTVMIGTEEGKYRIVVAYEKGVTVSAISGVPAFSSYSSPSLPEQVREGDYVVMGQQSPEARNLGDVSSYARGFLMRVKLVTPP